VVVSVDQVLPAAINTLPSSSFVAVDQECVSCIVFDVSEYVHQAVLYTTQWYNVHEFSQPAIKTLPVSNNVTVCLCRLYQEVIVLTNVSVAGSNITHIFCVVVGDVFQPTINIFQSLSLTP